MSPLQEQGVTHEKLISLKEAAELCEYSQEYLSLRSRQGKLKAKKIGRTWMTTKSLLDEYINSTKEYFNNLNDAGESEDQEAVLKNNQYDDRLLGKKGPALASQELTPSFFKKTSAVYQGFLGRTEKLSQSVIDSGSVFYSQTKGTVSNRPKLALAIASAFVLATLTAFNSTAMFKGYGRLATSLGEAWSSAPENAQWGVDALKIETKKTLALAGSELSNIFDKTPEVWEKALKQKKKLGVSAKTDTDIYRCKKGLASFNGKLVSALASREKSFLGDALFVTKKNKRQLARVPFSLEIGKIKAGAKEIPDELALKAVELPQTTFEATLAIFGGLNNFGGKVGDYQQLNENLKTKFNLANRRAWEDFKAAWLNGPRNLAETGNSALQNIKLAFQKSWGKQNLAGQKGGKTQKNTEKIKLTSGTNDVWQTVTGGLNDGARKVSSSVIRAARGIENAIFTKIGQGIYAWLERGQQPFVPVGQRIAENNRVDLSGLWQEIDKIKKLAQDQVVIKRLVTQQVTENLINKKTEIVQVVKELVPGPAGPQGLQGPAGPPGPTGQGSVTNIIQGSGGNSYYYSGSQVFNGDIIGTSISVSKDGAVGRDFGVAGSTSLGRSGSDILTVKAKSDFYGPTTINDSLTASGPVSFGGKLNVTGATSLSNNLSVLGNLTASGTSNFENITIDGTGNKIFLVRKDNNAGDVFAVSTSGGYSDFINPGSGSYLRVLHNGTNASLASSLGLINLGTSVASTHSLGTGDVLAGGKFETSGAAYFDSTASVTSTFEAGNDYLRVDGTTGAVTFGANASHSFNGGLNINRSLTVGNNLSVLGNLTASGTSNFENITIDGTGNKIFLVRKDNNAGDVFAVSTSGGYSDFINPGSGSYLRVLHNGTNASLASSLGLINLGTSVASTHSLGTGDVLAGGKFETSGAAYFDSTASVTSTFEAGNDYLRVDGTTGAVTFGANASHSFNGGLNINRSLTVGGSITMGTTNTNYLTVNGTLNSHLIPALNNTYDLGSTSYYYRNVYAKTLIANNISAAGTNIAGTTAETFALNTDNVTADTEDSSFIFTRGSVTPNATIKWNSAIHQIEFNQNVWIQDGTPTTGATLFTIKAGAGQGANNLTRWLNYSGQPLGVFTASGSFGVYDSAPEARLAVTGSGTYDLLNLTSFGGAKGDLLTVTSLGNVGIGTTAPVSKLELLNSTASSTFTITASSAATYDPMILFRNSVNGTKQNLFSLGVDTSDTGPIDVGKFKLAYGGSLGASNLITVTSGGYMGIGTTTPDTNLTVTAAGALGFYGRSHLKSSANGYLTLLNNAETDFSMLRFGGLTSAFPGIKKNGTELQVRLADDSGFGNFQAGQGTFNGNIIASATANVDVVLKSLSATGDDGKFVLRSSSAYDSFNILNGAGSNLLAMTSAGYMSLGTATPGTTKLTVQQTSTGNIVDFKNSSVSSIFTIANSGNITVAGAIAYSGSGKPKRTIVLTADGATVPTTGGATQTKVDGTNHSYYVLDCNDSASNAAYWHWTMPGAYDAGTVNVTLYWEAAATSGNVVWDIQTAGVSPNVAQNIDPTLGAAQAVTTTVAAGANNLVTSVISNWTTGWHTGDYIVFKAYRDGAAVGDTMTGNARLVKVKIEYYASTESD